MEEEKTFFFNGYHVQYITNDISGCYAATLHLFASSASSVRSLGDKGKMNMLIEILFSLSLMLNWSLTFSLFNGCMRFCGPV